MWKAAALDCELLLKMFPPAITASTKWSKWISKLAGKRKQFPQIETWWLLLYPGSTAHIHPAAYLHTVPITGAWNQFSLCCNHIFLNFLLYLKLLGKKKILDNSSLELFARNTIHRFGLHLFYSYSKFILNVMPFKIWQWEKCILL